MNSLLSIHSYDALGEFAREAGEELGLDHVFHAEIDVEMVGPVGAFISLLAEAAGGKPHRTQMGPEGAYLASWRDMVVAYSYRTAAPFEKRKLALKVFLQGDYERVRIVYQTLETLRPEKSAKAHWFFRNSKGEQQNLSVDLAMHNPPRDEFFPWIEEGVHKFQNDFLTSDANVLLLIGEPGCGKTSFIRDMIFHNNLSVAITHDEALMGMDEFFITFLSGDYDALILEDADRLLRDRQDGNQLMSKLLNASDGLIRTKKKLILTANITHMTQVDSALTRPGRCYSAMHFRELTLPEAVVAARAAGVSEPTAGCTLAGLFGQEPARQRQARRVGFQ